MLVLCCAIYIIPDKPLLSLHVCLTHSASTAISSGSAPLACVITPAVRTCRGSILRCHDAMLTPNIGIGSNIQQQLSYRNLITHYGGNERRVAVNVRVVKVRNWTAAADDVVQYFDLILTGKPARICKAVSPRRSGWKQSAPDTARSSTACYLLISNQLLGIRKIRWNVLSPAPSGLNIFSR